MSLAVLGLLVLLTGVHLRRAPLAFVGAAVAAFSYPGAVVGGVAVAAALVIHPEARQSMRRLSVSAAAGAVFGLAATLVVLQATVHHTGKLQKAFLVAAAVIAVQMTTMFLTGAII